MAFEFKSNRTAIERQMQKNIGAALEVLGMTYTGQAMDEMDKLIYHAPDSPSGNIRTGRLRSGQTYQIDMQNKVTIVGNTVEYAPHVHYPGIRRNWNGRPWMTNAINNGQDDLRAAVARVIGQGFE